MQKKNMKSPSLGWGQLLIWSLVMLAVFTAMAAFADLRLLWTGLAVAAVEICGVLVWLTVLKKRRAGLEKAKQLMDEHMFMELLGDYRDGIAVLDKAGKILWYNQSFLQAVGSEKVAYQTALGTLLSEKLPMSALTECADSPEDKRAEATTPSGVYAVAPYRFGQQREYFLTVWYDMNLVYRLRKEAAMKNPVISYITVDNYSEIAGFMQNNYRAVTAKISVILKEWAQSLDAILHEVERDRYMLIMEEGKLEQLQQNKFEILDTVREASADDVDIPVTVSIGCAVVDGSFSEKELASRRALDLALQRGGDQAVLMLRGDPIKFGGKTKTVQKRTKIRSRIIAGELTGLMKKASNVLIMGHRFADHDSIGSCVGIARLASEYCDRVNIVVNASDSNLKLIFKKLHGIDLYRNMFIDGEAAQDLITSTTLLVVCDVSNVNYFEAPKLYENCATTVIIDHHRKTDEFAIPPRISYIEPSASSAGELVSEILEQALRPGSLLKEEAELLLAGMLLDTKKFSCNTGVRTFSAALYLRGEGASPGEAQMLLRADLGEFKREIRFESNVTIYRGIYALAVYEGEAQPEDRIAASKAADRLLTIDGVLASFTLCQINGEVVISARSSGRVNVQLILEKINGGGHFDSAGAQMKNVSISKAMQVLKELIDSYTDEK